MDLHKTKQQVGLCIVRALLMLRQATGELRLTTNLGEATTFPLIVYFVFLHEARIQMAFCPEILKVRAPMTLGPHNFVFKPRIEMNTKAKL